MVRTMEEYFLIIKALHMISVIAWMAGMFYLPRLYVYHTENSNEKKICEVFEVMERKLLRMIINPAMISSFLFGLMLIYIYGFSNYGGWLHVKLLMLLFMVIFHAMLVKYRKELANGVFKHSSKYYRSINEVPTILMIIIVFLAILRPF